MAKRSAEGSQPLYTIIAGPNGSGKSTLTAALKDSGLLGLCINPDEIAAQLPAGTKARDRVAREVTVAATAKHFAAGESFARESAFSGQTIMKSMDAARDAGYRLEVIFVAVQNVEEAIDRVRKRVELGGHGLPEAEQRRRFELSMANAAVAARTADSVSLYENPVGRGPRLIAQVDQGKVVELKHPRPQWVDRVLAGMDRSPRLQSERQRQPKLSRGDELDR